jgi:uncharacterized protein YgiM (DUF1202 family)
MNKVQRRVSSILAAAGLALAVGAPIATANPRACGNANGSYLTRVSGNYDYTTANLILRAAPSTSARKILTIPQGREVYVFGNQGNWAEVNYNGRTGWVCSAHLI